MNQEWSIFYNNLPQQVKDFLDQRVSGVGDFKHEGVEGECILFRSPSTKIEINVWGDMIGFGFFVWFPNPYDNNSIGDPTHTEHEFTWNHTFLSFVNANEIFKHAG